MLCMNFTLELTSCSSRHILESSHLTSALPENRSLFGSNKTSHGVKVYFKSCTQSVFAAGMQPHCTPNILMRMAVGAG